MGLQLNINDNHLCDITEEPLTIGRSSEVKLRLPFPDVSRKHAIIYTKDGKVFIVDNKSLNHTYLNGETLDDNHWYELKEGDTIRIAGFTLKVEAKLPQVMEDE